MTRCLLTFSLAGRVGGMVMMIKDAAAGQAGAKCRVWSWTRCCLADQIAQEV